MKSKLLIFTLIATILMSLALVSAATLTQTITSVNVTSTLTDLSGVTVPIISNDQGTNIAPTPSYTGSNITFSASPTYDYLTTGKTYSGVYTFTNGTSNESQTLNFVKTFCTNGAINDSIILITEVSVDSDSDGDGDEDTWYPLDIISIDVTVDIADSTVYDEVQDVIIEFGLIDSNGNNVADDLIWISKDDEKADLGDIDEGDDATHTFEFKIPNDLAEDDEDYKIVVKAYSDGDEDSYCDDSSTDLEDLYSQTITMKRESSTKERAIGYSDIDVEPSTIVKCGEEVTFSTKAYNLAGKQEDAVKFVLYSKYLNLSKEIVHTKDFDWDDSKTLDFTFAIPSNAEEKKYTLELYALYDYQKDDDKDDNDELTYNAEYFKEEGESQTFPIYVEGNCIGSRVDSKITASLSEATPKAIAGKEIVVQIEVENTGDVKTTYAVSVSGVSSWAEATVEPSSVTLDAGDSTTVDITLNIDSDTIAEEKEFTVKVGDQEQKILIDVEEGMALSQISGHLKDNWFIYTVILVDIILIVAIIIAVRRMIVKRA